MKSLLMILTFISIATVVIVVRAEPIGEWEKDK